MMLTTIGEALARLGPLLVIVNSSEDDRDGASALFDQIDAVRPLSTVAVVADLQWQDWLEQRGLEADSLLFAVDSDNRPLELNYFLETAPALLWIRSKAFTTVVGTRTHSLYNEEVKLPLEERLCACLGSGRMVAHTLPLEYAYLFDLPMLLRRCGRPSKIAEYESTCRQILEDLYREWSAAVRAEGAPDDVRALRPLADYFVPSQRREEEVTLDRGDVAEGLAPSVAHLQGRLQELLQQAVDLASHYREQYEERAEAVIIRDKMLADLHAPRDESPSAETDSHPSE